MKPTFYSEYRETGEIWFKNVPSHWKTLPLCAIAKIKSITNCVDRELLSVYLDLGVIRFSDVKEKRTNVTSEDLSEYQAVDPGDFVLNNQQAWRGSVGVSKYSGIVSPAYLVLNVQSELNPDYANFLFRDRKMVDQYLVCSKGVGSIQRNLYWPHLKRVTITIPSIEEQVRIAKVVKFKTAQINKFIRNKRRLIELLKEQKQNFINQAVIRGLDPNVKLKSSGVQWIGDIPSHWELLPLYSVAKKKSVTNCQERELLSVYLDLGVIRFTEVQEKRTNATSEDLSKYQAVEPGDFVLNNQQAWRGSVGVSKYSGIVSPAYFVLGLNDKLISDFANALLRGKAMVNQYLLCSKGVGSIQRNLYWPHLKRVVLPVPPHAEQQQIVKHIAERTLSIDQAISRAQREIELMLEYRTRLISDIVTGQTDVRGIEVPEIAEEELQALEEDTADADDMIDDEGDMDEND